MAYDDSNEDDAAPEPGAMFRPAELPPAPPPSAGKSEGSRLRSAELGLATLAGKRVADEQSVYEHTQGSLAALSPRTSCESETGKIEPTRAAPVAANTSQPTLCRLLPYVTDRPIRTCIHECGLSSLCLLGISSHPSSSCCRRRRRPWQSSSSSTTTYCSYTHWAVER